MMKIIVSILLLIAFVGVAECEIKTKPPMKKQVARVRCQPGYMFERGKCVIIPDMENTSIRHKN